MIVTTTVTRSYLPAARVLARSHRETSPGGTTYVLLVDGPAPDSDDLVVLQPSDLSIDPALFRRMATYYSVTELATALKPWLLHTLLDRHESVVFFDPDTAMFADCSELGDLSAEHGIVLTPHANAPIPEDGERPSEKDLSIAGAYNTGLVGVGRSARPFLDWWALRLERDCRIDPSEGLYVDQRWIDLAAHYFPNHVVRDPAYNVAYWNLHERTVTREGDRWLVDGRPLRFFHFSGTKTSATTMTTYFGGKLREFPESAPALGPLFDWYRAALSAADPDGIGRTPYAYATSVDGVELTPRLRQWYRDALDAGESPPDALTPGFAEWAAAEGARQQRLRAKAAWDEQRLRVRSLGRTLGTQVRDAVRSIR